MDSISAQGLDVLVNENEHTTIDIIAIPGLGADPQRSFGSETDKGFNWLSDPKDGLPSDLPTARVLLYQYDSRWKWVGKALAQTVSNAANLLIDSLVIHRQKNENRPIIFLAHSLGGLVVAKALTLVKSRPEETDRFRLYECFAGAMFFGTPFRGAPLATKAVLLAAYAEYAKAATTDMLEFLKPGNIALEELRNDFVQLIRKEPSPKIVCLTELKALKPLTSVVVTKESASLDNADIRDFACDHRQLNRFNRVKDGRYESVRGLLKTMVNAASTMVKKRLMLSRRSVVDDATFVGLSDSLNSIDFRQKRRIVESISGDSEWILQGREYTDWLTQPINCLWVSGDEGLGKSKAALLVVQNIEKEEEKNGIVGAKDVLVAYHFCDSSPDSRSTENLLKSLMWQLIVKRRALAQYVTGLSAANKSRNGKSSFDLPRLWKGLRDMLSDPSIGTVYFVINNVHELSNEGCGLKEFLALIKSEVLIGSDGFNDPFKNDVKWLFLSRNRTEIKEVLHDESVIWYDLENGSKNSLFHEAVRTYVQERVKVLADSKHYDLSLQFFVTSILQKRAENNRLWVEVVCLLLEGISPDYTTIRQTLESLPQNLDDLINQTWKKALETDAEGINVTKEILRTLAITEESPTINELKIIAGLDNDVNIKEDEDDDAAANRVLKRIRACGPLLRVYESSDYAWGPGDVGSLKVAFIHPRAQTSLLKNSRKLIGWSEDLADETEVRWQHGILALRCFSYILSQLQEDEDQSDWLLTEPSTEKDKEAQKDQAVFNELFPEIKDDSEDDAEILDLEYPAKYWLRHGHNATPDFVATLDLDHAFWASESSARRNWWGSYAEGEAGGFEGLKHLTALHIAAYFGLDPLVKSLLAHGHAQEIFARDSWGYQPLHWAARQGHVDVIDRLLSNGAQLNSGEQDFTWTPLHCAASGGQNNLKAMELLINSSFGSANINAVAEKVGTPLALALSWNQTAAVKLLLEHNANPLIYSNDSETPLVIAAINGYDEFVDQFLHAGASENLLSRDFGTALAAGASSGNLKIVESLFRYDNTESSLQRALKEAAKRNAPLVIKYLLENSSGLRCDDAFETAASLGYDTVITELWLHSQEPYHNGLSKTTIDNALYKATDAEQESTVELLLQQCHADAKAKGEQYGDAIGASAYDGTYSIIKLLLESGADVNATSGYPLQAAASRGHDDVVAILLAHGATVDACSNLFKGGTPLEAACAGGHIETARKLLSAGANCNRGVGQFENLPYNPLIAAASQGDGPLVELLLQWRANPNVFGGSDGSTPLINAAATLVSKYLKLLIQQGAAVDTMDPDGDTALIVSAIYGDDDCIKLLLDEHANPNISGKHNGAALHAAASNGYSNICKLLLERGADPNVRGGPFDTTVQAAAFSGDRDCMRAVLGKTHRKLIGNNARELVLSAIHTFVPVDVNAQGGQYFTALHAAAIAEDDGALQELLDHTPKPELNVIRPGVGTALQAAAFAGCNRNARYLLEADCDPNIVSGKHGTALQAAALKCRSELCELLIQNKAKEGILAGKYGSPLVAAVSREYSWDTEILELLLEQDFPLEHYKKALQQALELRRKDHFKLIWASLKEKAPNFKPRKPVLSLILAGFRNQVRSNKVTYKDKQDNEDFADDVLFVDQDFEDQIEDEDEGADATARDGSDHPAAPSGEKNTQTNARGINSDDDITGANQADAPNGDAANGRADGDDGDNSGETDGDVEDREAGGNGNDETDRGIPSTEDGDEGLNGDNIDATDGAQDENFGEGTGDAYAGNGDGDQDYSTNSYPENQQDDPQGNYGQTDDGQGDDTQGDYAQADDGQGDDGQGDDGQGDDGQGDDGQTDYGQGYNGQQYDGQGDDDQRDDGQGDGGQGDGGQGDDDQGDDDQEDNGYAPYTSQETYQQPEPESEPQYEQPPEKHHGFGKFLSHGLKSASNNISRWS